MDYAKAYLEAKSYGYSDAEIAQHLAADKYSEAHDSGYSDQEIINHLTKFNVPGGTTMGDTIEPGVSGDTNPPEQRVVQNLGQVAAGYGVAQLAGLAAGKILPKANNAIAAIRNYLTAGKNAESTAAGAQAAFGTLETPSTVGMTMKEGLNTEQATNEATRNALYKQVPETPIDIPTTQSTAQDILTAQGKLPASFQSNEIIQKASDLTNAGTPGFGSQPTPQTLSQMRSALYDLARNGQGIEKLHAAQLAGSINADLEAASSEANPVAQSLRNANTFYSTEQGLNNASVVQRLSNGRIEDLPDMIFKGGRTQDVLAAKAALGDNAFALAKKSFFNDLVNAKDIGKTLAKYSENNSDFLPTVFNQQEIGVLQKIDQLKKMALQTQNAISAGKKVAGVAALGTGGYSVLHGLFGKK